MFRPDGLREPYERAFGLLPLVPSSTTVSPPWALTDTSARARAPRHRRRRSSRGEATGQGKLLSTSGSRITSAGRAVGDLLAGDQHDQGRCENVITARMMCSMRTDGDAALVEPG